MNIKTLELGGIEPALKAMRNPLDSWDRSDTTPLHVGEADASLSRKLTNAGTEHCKHLRMIHVWADMTLPRYVWSEMDTYIFNTKISCSTMHTIHKRTLNKTDFMNEDISQSVLDELNEIIAEMQNTKDTAEKNYLRTILKRKLPEGFLQTRTVDFNYAELLNIYYQRKNHKLSEWHTICDWIKRLPQFEKLTGITVVGG